MPLFNIYIYQKEKIVLEWSGDEKPEDGGFSQGSKKEFIFTASPRTVSFTLSFEVEVGNCEIQFVDLPGGVLKPSPTPTENKISITIHEKTKVRFFTKIVVHEPTRFNVDLVPLPAQVIETGMVAMARELLFVETDCRVCVFSSLFFFSYPFFSLFFLKNLFYCSIQVTPERAVERALEIQRV